MAYNGAMPREVQSVEDKAAAKARYKAWYERSMADPNKRAQILAQRREYKAKRKASGNSPKSETVVSPEPSVVSLLEASVVSQPPKPAAQVGRGGKYSSTQPQGEVSLTPEAIIEQWQRHFGSQEHD